MHSFRAKPQPGNKDWVLATTHYGSDFVSAIQKGNIAATQFHPEKSGVAGLDLLRSFLEGQQQQQGTTPVSNGTSLSPSQSQSHSLQLLCLVFDSLQLHC